MSENIASASLASSEALRPFLAIDTADTGNDNHGYLKPMHVLELLSQYRHYALPPAPNGRPTGDVYIHKPFNTDTAVCVLTDHDGTAALNETARLDRNQLFSTFLRKRHIPHTAEDLDSFMNTLHLLSSPGGNHDPAIMTRMLAQAAFHLAKRRTQHNRLAPEAVPFGQGDARHAMAQIQDTFFALCNSPPDERDMQPFYYDNGTFTTTSTFDKQGGSLLESIYLRVTWPLFHQSDTAVSGARYILRSEYGIPVGILSKGARGTQLLRIANEIVDHGGSMPPGVIIITPENKGDALEAAICQGVFTNPDLRLVHLDDNIKHIKDLQAAYARLRKNGSRVQFSPVHVTMEAPSVRYSHPINQGLARLAVAHRLNPTPEPDLEGIPVIDRYYDSPSIAQKVAYILQAMQPPLGLT